MALLDELGGRDWRRGASVPWIMTEPTYADAVTTGPLSVVPHPPYGYTARKVEQFAARVPTGERTSVGGRG
jgi:hypothetical protein